MPSWFEPAPMFLGKAFLVYEDKDKELRMVVEIDATELEINSDYEDYRTTDLLTYRIRPPRVRVDGRLVQAKIWDGGDPFGPQKKSLDEGTKEVTDGDEVVEGEIIPESEYEDDWNDD